tara:strand:+ start:30610 stop:30834 length:225 start_codon:yes stop_codon:yes gene_type:complete
MQLSDKSKINYIMDKISTEYTNALLKEGVCDLSLSIGYSFINKQKQPFEALLNDADHAMYKNKQAYRLSIKEQI